MFWAEASHVRKTMFLPLRCKSRCSLQTSYSVIINSVVHSSRSFSLELCSPQKLCFFACAELGAADDRKREAPAGQGRTHVQNANVQVRMDGLLVLWLKGIFSDAHPLAVAPRVRKRATPRGPSCFLGSFILRPRKHLTPPRLFQAAPVPVNSCSCCCFCCPPLLKKLEHSILLPKSYLSVCPALSFNFHFIS